MGIFSWFKKKKKDEPRPMTGMFAYMSKDQQKRALAYRGPENHGNATYLKESPPTANNTSSGSYSSGSSGAREINLIMAGSGGYSSYDSSSSCSSSSSSSDSGGSCGGGGD